MSTPQKTVPVVCALIERDGRVLLARRPAHKRPALKWEFPGGKVNAGETPEDALRREIREELGCTIAIAGALPRVVQADGSVTIELIPFACRLGPGSADPVPLEHLELRWVAPGELLALDLAAADRPVARAYLAPRQEPVGFRPPGS